MAAEGARGRTVAEGTHGLVTADGATAAEGGVGW